MNTATFSSSDDIISVEDITTRVDELRGEIDSLNEDYENAEEGDEAIAAKKSVEEWECDYREELDTLESLLSDLCGYGGDHQWEGDWYPATLIAEDHFEDYAQELAEDCGMVNRDAKWPNNHIDWEAAAEELKQDYSEVDFEGNTLYYR